MWLIPWFGDMWTTALETSVALSSWNFMFLSFFRHWNDFTSLSPSASYIQDPFCILSLCFMGSCSALKLGLLLVGCLVNTLHTEVLPTATLLVSSHVSQAGCSAAVKTSRKNQALQRQTLEWEAQQSLSMKAGEREGQSLDIWEQRFTLNREGALVASKITINVCLQEVVERNRSS